MDKPGKKWNPELLRNLPFWEPIVYKKIDDRQVFEQIRDIFYQFDYCIEFSHLIAEVATRFKPINLDELNYVIGLNEPSILDVLIAMRGLIQVSFSHNKVVLRCQPITQFSEQCCSFLITNNFLKMQCYRDNERFQKLDSFLKRSGGFVMYNEQELKDLLLLPPDITMDNIVTYLRNVFENLVNVEFVDTTTNKTPPNTTAEKVIMRNLKTSRQYPSFLYSNECGHRIKRTLHPTYFRRPLIVVNANSDYDKTLQGLMRKAQEFANELRRNPVYLPRVGYCCLEISECNRIRRVQLIRPLFGQILAIDVDSAEVFRSSVQKLFEAPMDLMLFPRMSEPLAFITAGMDKCLQKDPKSYFGPNFRADHAQRAFDAAFSHAFVSPCPQLGGPSRNLRDDRDQQTPKCFAYNVRAYVFDDDFRETGDILFPKAKAGQIKIVSRNGKELYPEEWISKCNSDRSIWKDELELRGHKISEKN